MMCFSIWYHQKVDVTAEITNTVMKWHITGYGIRGFFDTYRLICPVEMQ